jgi:hypothetical protein
MAAGQEQIGAEICGVARQTVSNWKKGFRNPGYQAKRKLLNEKME